MHRRYLPENKLSKNKIRTPISKCHRGQVHEVYAAKSCVCLATELEADVSFFFTCSLCFLSHRFPFPERSICYHALFSGLLFLILNLLNTSRSHFDLCCLFLHALAQGSSLFVDEYVYPG